MHTSLPAPPLGWSSLSPSVALDSAICVRPGPAVGSSPDCCSLLECHFQPAGGFSELVHTSLHLLAAALSLLASTDHWSSWATVLVILMALADLSLSLGGISVHAVVSLRPCLS